MTKLYSKINVLIADDHELVRDGLHVMAKRIEEIEIVGEAKDGQDLVMQTRRLSPDVIITDVKMPNMDGVEATRIIKSEFPNIGIIALSSFDEQSLVLDMLNAGAKGYLLKNAGRKELTDAVVCVYRDEPYYCKEISHQLAQAITSGGYLGKAKSKSTHFTERELEVIQEMCKGFSSKQIASNMGIKPRTVERYRDYIMEKMGVNSATAVVMWAVSNGLCKPVIEKK